MTDTTTTTITDTNSIDEKSYKVLDVMGGMASLAQIRAQDQIQDQIKEKKSDTKIYPVSTMRELLKVFNEDQNKLTDRFTKFYGWVRRIRLGGHDKIIFLDLYDGSCMDDMMCVITDSNTDSNTDSDSNSKTYQGSTFNDIYHIEDLPEASQFKTLSFQQMLKSENLSDGCAVCVEGFLTVPPKDEKEQKSRKQKFELHGLRVRLIGNVESPQTYPIQKSTEKSIISLRQLPMYRMRSKTMQAIFRICSKADLAIAIFMNDNGITKFDPNIITMSDCEGAGETFKISPQIFSKDKEGKDISVGLTVSSQLPLEAGITGLNGVYTAQKSFRAEKSDTLKHLAEFYHVEFERAFESLTKLLDFTENYVKYITTYIMKHCSDELDFLESKFSSQDVISSRKLLTKLMDKPFIRIKHKDAINLIQKIVSTKIMLPDTDGKMKRVKVDKLPKQGEDLGSEHEKLLVRYFGWMNLSETERETITKTGKSTDEIGAFVFVTHWPLAIKSFYMKQCDDNSGDNLQECESFDLLAPRVGEMFGGSMREWRYDKLKNEIDKRKMDAKPIQWFVDLRKNGSMPHGGWGMGFARYCMLITGAPTVRDVVPFPVYYTHCPY